MERLMVEIQTSQQVGEGWIEAIMDQEFERLAWFCHPDVKSSLLLPSRVIQLENSTDLSRKVEDWFGESSSIIKEQTRVSMVGERLGIFYRLRLVEDGIAYVAEQQVYCTLRDGLISQLRLICSGFQPDDMQVEAFKAGKMDNRISQSQPSHSPALKVDALLEFQAAEGLGSTCALLTPYIKHKLGELSSGQVLEVRVDDPTAKEDIEAWSRLSGNQLLRIDSKDDLGLVFFIMKK